MFREINITRNYDSASDINWLKEHICLCDNSTVFDAKFPIPSNYGEGFQFEYNGEIFETCGKWEGGKRVLDLSVTTFGSYTAEASHYYCRIRLPLSCKSTTRKMWIDGSIVDEKVPKQFRDVTFDLCKPLTLEEIENDRQGRWIGFDEGDSRNAFYTEEEMLEVINNLTKYFDNGWRFKIKY